MTHSKIVETEERKKGLIAGKIVWKYISNMGGLPILGVIIILYQISGITGLLSQYWITQWTARTWDISDYIYLGIYAIVGVFGALGITISNTFFSLICLSASNKLHHQSIRRLLWAPKSFFDANPSGRILSRLSKDQEIIDEAMIGAFQQCIQTLISIITILAIIILAVPWFVVPLVVLSFIFFIVQQFYNVSSRELKRLDANTRSPLYSHFAESITGFSTIRCFKGEDRIIQQNRKLLKDNMSIVQIYYSGQRWLGWRLGAIGTVIVFLASLVAVLQRDVNLPYFPAVTVSIIGLALTNVLQLGATLGWLVEQATEAESNLASMERIVHYATDIPLENSHETSPEINLDPSWPKKGAIEFKDYKLRYRPGLPLVLKGVTLRINPGEKVGVVGRTGAGKSTLMLGLYRIIEAAEGSIYIDGINIKTIGLKDLRKNLSIIPQDPVMFSGTVRFNIDPFRLSNDAEIWEVLDKANLKKSIQSMNDKLDEYVSEGGSNFSLGQRQLVCLARALLKKSKILILDEATASVDLDTDQFIQETVQREFKNCTTLTIAHRLNTIIDYDKILVMENGKVAEFDTPNNLVKNDESIFLSMINETGPTTAKMLIGFAKGSIQNKDLLTSLMTKNPTESDDSDDSDLEEGYLPEAKEDLLVLINE